MFEVSNAEKRRAHIIRQTSGCQMDNYVDPGARSRGAVSGGARKF